MQSRFHRFSPLGKGLRALLELAAVLLLVFWLLVGIAAASFHGLIVPRAPQWRDDVAQLLSRALGAPVRLAGLRAYSDAGVPTLEITGLEIRDRQGEVALSVQHAWASLSTRSLLHLGFDQVQVQGLSLQVQRDVQGQWWVGGIALPTTSAASPSWGMNWLFQQAYARVDQAHIQWQDAWWAAQQGLSQVPTLSLNDVHAVLRNDGRHHRWRLDATPSVAPQQVWTLRGDLRSPTLTRALGDWRQWSGQVYAHAAGVDLGLLTRHLDARAWTGVQSASGQGDWRAWAEVVNGQVQRVTNDWALRHFEARLRQDLQPLALRHLGGRLRLERPEQGWRVETQGLAFETADGLVWPGGDVQWRWQAASAKRPEDSQLTATNMDLGAMTAVALRLPLPEAILAPWRSVQPQGRVDRLQLSWQGPLQQVTRFQAKGDLRELSLQAGILAADARPGELARPGVKGLNLRFDANEQGGQASLDMSGGWWWLPGVWDDPAVAITALRSDLSWGKVDGAWQVKARQLRFQNPDLEANGEVIWTDGPGSGLLDLRLQAKRANLARLGRYLPKVSGVAARRYVGLAIQAGTGRDVEVRVQGPVDEVPFVNPERGVFRIAGRVEGVRFDVAPKAITGKSWMRLKDFSGRYVQDSTSLRLEGVQARWDGQERLRITQGEAQITDLRTQPQLRVKAQAQGPLQAWLGGMESTALRGVMGRALDGVRATGQGQLSLDLGLSLASDAAPEVRGVFDVSQATVAWSPDVPVAMGSSATVDFDGKGVRVQAQVAQLLGGPAQLRAQVNAQGAWQAQVQGRYSVEAVKQLSLLGGAQAWLRKANGGGTYTLGLQRASAQQALDWDLVAGLKGVALDLPAPLRKAAEADWQLSWKEQSGQTRLRLGPVAAPVLRAQLQPEPSQWRGHVLVGAAATVPLDPASADGGLLWSLKLPELDADAWQTWWDEQGGSAMLGAKTSASPSPTGAWRPTQVRAEASSLRFGGWDFHDLQLQARPQQGAWRADVSARELKGWVRLEPGSTQLPQGRVVARFEHLHLGSEAVNQVETALVEQPRDLPALDIEVERFKLKGRDWDRVSLRARNEVVTRGGRRLAQWRLEHLSAQMPEATLSASGLWAPVDVDLMAAAQGLWRRTQLEVALEVRDSGALLARFDMPGVLKAGAGRLSGQLSWQGSPLNFDKKSLGGYLHLDVGSGQFLKADPGIAKLLGVLSLQSLPRRLLLDFRDVFTTGFAFDSIKGRAQISDGVLFTRDLAMRGPAAAVLIEGRADVRDETQDVQVLVLPKLDAGTLSLWAGLANPVMGLATYVAQKVFGDAVANASVQAMHVTGSWQDPKVQQISKAAPQAPAPVRSLTPVVPVRTAPVPSSPSSVGEPSTAPLKPLSPIQSQ